MFRPDLTKIRSSSTAARAINQLNRTVSAQSNIRPGNGLGISAGASGRMISLNAPILMYAMSTDGGIPEAEDASEGGLKFGAGKAYIAYIKLVDDEYVLHADTDSEIEVLNKSRAAVMPNSWMTIAKILNVWQVVPEGAGGLAGASCTVEIPTGTLTAPSSSGRAQIYREADDGTWEPSGDPVEVWCRHTMDTPVPVGGTIQIGVMDGRWWLMSRDC